MDQMGDRLVVLSRRPYDFEDRETRKRVVGCTVWVIDPASQDDYGCTPLKLSQREAELFPRPLAVYAVRYAQRVVNGKRETVITQADYLEQWYAMPGGDGPALLKKVVNS